VTQETERPRGGGILSAAEIRRRQTAATNPLVIVPLLEPNEQIRDHQASVDLRLGCRFRIAQVTSEDVVDTLSEKRRPPMPPLKYAALGSTIVLHPHNLILGETLEFVRLPSDVAGYVIGRSSWGREGLIVATAIGIHPAFAGPVTLELRNLGEVPIRLYPGDLIAQLFLHEVQGSALPGPLTTSQFAGASGPNRGRHRYEETERKLKKLRTRGAG
jgi:dCTP deaminase